MLNTRTEGEEFFRFNEYRGKEFSVVVCGPQSAPKRHLVKSLWLTSLDDQKLQQELGNARHAVRYRVIELLRSFFKEVKAHGFDLTTGSSAHTVMGWNTIDWNEKIVKAITEVWTDPKLTTKLGEFSQRELLSSIMQKWDQIQNEDYCASKEEYLDLTGVTSDIDFFPNHRSVTFKEFECRLLCVEKDELKFHPSFDSTVLLAFIMNVDEAQEDFEKSIGVLKEFAQSPFFFDPMNSWFTIPIYIIFNKTKAFKAQVEKGTNWFIKSGTPPDVATRIVEDRIANLLKGRRFFCNFADLAEEGDAAAVKNLGFIQKIIVGTLNDASEARLLAFHDLYGSQSLKDYLKKKLSTINVANLPAPDQLATSKTFVKQFPSLTKSLYGNKGIAELNLRYNWLPDKLLKELFEALKVNKTVRFLNISGNKFSNIKDEGTIQLIQCLATNTSLNSLIMTETNLNDETAAYLFEVVKINKTLTILDVSNNQLTSASEDHIIELLTTNKTLASLALWTNKINGKTFRAIVEKGLSRNHDLYTLNIDKNPISADTIQSLIPELEQHDASSIQSLYLPVDHFGIKLQLHSVLEAKRKRQKQKPQKEWMTWINTNSNLKKLFLNEIDLNKFPDRLLELKSLEVLVLTKNQIPSIPDNIFLLESLVCLDCSQNMISSIPPTIKKLKKLEILDLRFNQIREIPQDIADLDSLRSFHLQSNQILSIPAAVLNLKGLQDLDLLNNLIPEGQRRTITARLKNKEFLDLSGLEMHYVPNDVQYISALKVLNLSNNKLTCLPPEIGKLTQLLTLNVQDNHLEELPWQLSEMKTLKQLIITGNPLSKIPKEYLQASETASASSPSSSSSSSSSSSQPSELVIDHTSALFTHLLDSKDGSIPLHRIKLVFAGEENVGKTTLVNALSLLGKKDKDKDKNAKKALKNVSTDGIEVKQWDYSDDPHPTINFSLWDFAGQKIYYCSHAFFLSHRTVFLLVFNTKIEKDYLKRVDYWLSTIQCFATSSPFLVIGTHTDECKSSKKLDHIKETIMGKYGKLPNFKGYVPVSCKNQKTIEALKNEIVSVTRQQSFLGEKVPKSYIQLEELISVYKRSEHFPILTLTRFIEMATSCGISSDKIEVLLTLFHNLGTIIYFPDPKLGLQDLVILNPNWLASLMATLMTTKQNFVVQGVLTRQNLSSFVWKPPEYPEHLHEKCIQLLECFDVIHRIGKGTEEKILIPYLFPESKPALTWSNNQSKFYRTYIMEFFPLGFSSRIMVRIFKICKPIAYWRYGCMVEKDGGQILFEFDEDKLEVNVTFSTNNPVFIGKMIGETVDTMLSFFNAPYKMYYPCSHCMQGIQSTANTNTNTNTNTNRTIFSHEDIEDCMKKSSSRSIICKKDNTEVSLEALLPDLICTWKLDKLSRIEDLPIIEKIMPSQSTANQQAHSAGLADFVKFLTEADLSLATAIGQVGNKLTAKYCATDMAIIFEKKNKSETYCRTSFAKEIRANSSSLATLFREGTLGVFVMAGYIGLPESKKFLLSLILPIIKLISEIKKGTEVDIKLTNEKNYKDSIMIIRDVCQQILDRTIEAAQSCPIQIKNVCRYLGEEVEKVLNNKNSIVGAFYFLRYLLPPLTTPKKYGVYDGEISEDMHRQLVLITKVVQALSNNTLLRGQNMELLNEFIESNIPRLNVMFDFLTTPTGEKTPEISEKQFNFSVGRLYLFTLMNYYTIEASLAKMEVFTKFLSYNPCERLRSIFLQVKTNVDVYSLDLP